MIIGGVECATPIWLAPMAGVTTRTFRDWHRRAGASLTHTEMVSAIGLWRRDKKTRTLLGDDDEDRPLVLQLFGPTADDMAKGAEAALDVRSYDAIEINMACPMPKIMKRGSGAAMLSRVDEASRSVAALKRFDLPVWAKIRIVDRGTDQLCERLIEAGADLLMIHGRTPAQRYEGHADKERVIRAAQRFPGAIVGSGDVWTPEDAASYLDGACAAVLVARGAIRDAYIFAKISALRDGMPMPDIDHSSRISALISIGRAAAFREGDRAAIVMIRRMIGGMFRDYPGAAAERNAVVSARSWSEAEDLLYNIDQ